MFIKGLIGMKKVLGIIFCVLSPTLHAMHKKGNDLSLPLEYFMRHALLGRIWGEEDKRQREALADRVEANRQKLRDHETKQPFRIQEGRHLSLQSGPSGVKSSILAKNFEEGDDEK